jgi:hypothetical protein
VNEVTGKLSWFAPPPDVPYHKPQPRRSTISSYGFARPPTATASEVLQNGVDTSDCYSPSTPPESPPSPAVPESLSRLWPMLTITGMSRDRMD